MPIAPPMVTPRLRDIRKYSPPVPIGILVATADADNPVINDIELHKSTIKIVPSRPTLETTQPKRRYMITPNMVKTLGVKTPRKVPNLW